MVSTCDMNVALLWLVCLLSQVMQGVLSAKCTGEVTANLEVTGAFTKVNGTNYLIKSNEYATFTCSGNAQPEVEVESILEVSCSGTSSWKIKSSAGTGMVTAKWQSNDECSFVSSCTLKCSASTDCDKTGVQVYEVNKVIDIERTDVNCSDVMVAGCTSKTDFVHSITRNKPLGTGQFWGSTTCEGGNLNPTDNITTSTFVVQQPLDTCECKTTFTYREVTSRGEICQKPVFTEVMAIRNEEHCKTGLAAGLVAFIVIFVLLILFVVFLALRKRVRKKKEKSKKPSAGQVDRMTALDRSKLSALIEVANDPEVDDSAVKLGLPRPERSPEPDPVYDEI